MIRPATRRILERAAGRPLAPPSPATARDVARRAAHVARHSRLACPERGDVFNIDLHVAVIADVRTQLDRHNNLSLVDWTLSGHSWVAGRERDPVAIVNERTWHAFGPRMAKRFQRMYGSYLRSFQGFAVTHTPCFALLYEELRKPTVAVASTRYEFPFTHNADMWRWLDERLRAGVEDGWLTLVANNKADADYVKHYSRLDAVHIPSACSYVEHMYTGRQNAVVLWTNNDRLAESIGHALRHETVALRGGLGRRYDRATLYDQRAIVLIPYNVSVMAFFEHYAACAPIYVPDQAFMKRLMEEHPADVLSSLSFCQVTGVSPSARPGGFDLNDLRDEAVVDWYLERADFYDTEWMPRIQRFESWEHLDHLLATDDQHEISARMAEERPERLRRIAALWDELPWMRQLQAQGSP